MVANRTGAAATVGIDRSLDYLHRARHKARACAFIAHDASAGSYPTRPPDRVYARFLLVHLPDPDEVILRWHTNLAPGGVLLLGR